jgi:hypothetical protein
MTNPAKAKIGAMTDRCCTRSGDPEIYSRDVSFLMFDFDSRCDALRSTIKDRL